ncbi:MAG: hypothetical protein AABM43_06870 [Actinomycetota bacterium]
MSQQTSIWEKVNFEIVREAESGDGTNAEPWQKPDWLKAWQRRRPYIDALASVLWLYIILKAFVSDVDREIAKAVGAESLADYRFFFFLAIVALVALLVRRPRRVFIALAYIAFFPLVLVFFRLPIALVKTKSWIAFLTATNVVSAVVLNLRSLILGFAAGALGTLVIVISSWHALLMMGAITIAALLGVSYWRTIKFSLRPARFLQMQQRAIQRIVDGDGLRQLVAVNEALRSEQIERFDEEQQQTFVNKLGTSVLAHRCLYLWAYELDRYRRSGVPVLFNLLAYVGLLAQTVFSLTLINYAVYKIDGAAFSFVHTPSIWVFARYSISSLYGSEIAALQPQSDLANILVVLSFLAGVILLAGGAYSVFMGVRARTNDAAAQETIDRIRAQGRRLAELHKEEYEVSVDEAAQRLEDLRFALMGLIEYVTSRVPADFGWDEARDRSPRAS